MDANFVKLLADAGTVAILLFVLFQVLAVLKTTLNRVIDLLEREIDADKPELPSKV